MMNDDMEEFHYAIKEQVERLPLKHRVVFTLKYVDNLKESEITPQYRQGQNQRRDKIPKQYTKS